MALRHLCLILLVTFAATKAIFDLDKYAESLNADVDSLEEEDDDMPQTVKFNPVLGVHAKLEINRAKLDLQNRLEYCPADRVEAGWVGYADQAANECGCVCASLACLECPEDFIRTQTETEVKCTKKECPQGYESVSDENCIKTEDKGKTKVRYHTRCPEGYAIGVDAENKPVCKKTLDCCATEEARVTQLGFKNFKGTCVASVDPLACTANTGENVAEANSDMFHHVLHHAGASSLAPNTVHTIQTEPKVKTRTAPFDHDGYCVYHEPFATRKKDEKTATPTVRGVTGDFNYEKMACPSEDELKAMACGPATDSYRTEFVKYSRSKQAQICTYGTTLKHRGCRSCVAKCSFMVGRVKECSLEYYDKNNQALKQHCNFDSNKGVKANHDLYLATNAVKNPTTFARAYVPSNLIHSKYMETLGAWGTFVNFNFAIDCRSTFEGVTTVAGKDTAAKMDLETCVTGCSSILTRT